jgi:glutaconate CoA-transferase subunit A
MASKIMTLQEMVARIPDGTSLALGGSFLHRGPFAFVRELIRQKKRDLEIIKQSPGYDIDILCRAGCVKKARAGIVAMEGNFGLAPWYRRAVEKKQIVLEEHACATLTAGLRAAAFGVPFQPVGGVHGSDLPALNKWASIRDPYGSGEDVWVIPSIRPDIAVIHANEVNELGDTRIYGTFNWDRIMTRAAEAGVRGRGEARQRRELQGAARAHAHPQLHGAGDVDRAQRRLAGIVLAALRGRLPGGRGVHGHRGVAGRAHGEGAGTGP